ncbi:unnamed protein product [Withania somnifera]
MGCFLSSTKKTTPNSNTKTPTPFLEEKEEVKEILSEAPIIINNPINNINDEKNSIPQKNFSHNIHDSHVFQIAKIFNPRELTGSIRVGSDPKEPKKELSKSIRAELGPNKTVKELNKHIWTGPKETTTDLSKHIRVGSGQKEMKEELSRSKETMIKDIRKNLRRPDHLSGPVQTRNISPGRVGSGSCRRSRSPVMCGDQINGGTKNSIGKCPSVRKSGKSPGRVRSELGDRRRSPAPETGNGSRSNRENNRNNNKRNLTSGINESFENPQVSLECFIFI